jgi:hypothetical protein
MYRYLALLMVSAGLFLLTACAGGDKATPEPSTPEAAVVVFATPDPKAPTSTPLATALPVETPPPTATPTPAATAGMGISGELAESSTPVTNFADYVKNRPTDVNPLTGQKVTDPALLHRRPLLVRVGNDPVARPQVALNLADMVYEEITEWWVTRFTAIYLSQEPQTIAPVRSARLINLPLALQYQGALANSGGSDGVRWELSQTDIVNLDEFFVPQLYFYRENEGWQTRLAFDATTARDYLADEGLDTTTGLRGFLFEERLDEKNLPAGVVNWAKEVVVPYPQSTSRTTWKYNEALGKYLRFVTAEPHLDADNKQLSAANVIIYFADHQATAIVEDSNNATSIRIVMSGRGAAWLLRDGKILKGNWETDGTQTPMFSFDDGRPMPLKPGNTWVEVVPPEYQLTIDGQDFGTQPETAAPTAPLPPATPSASTPVPTLTPIGARPPVTPTGQ